MKPPSELRERVTFQRQAADGNGDLVGGWVDVVTRAADVVPLKGGEGVQVQRLEGSQPVIIIVRREALTRTIDNSFRAFDARGPVPPAAGATVWGVTSTIFNRADDTIEVMAVQRRGGSDA